MPAASAISSSRRPRLAAVKLPSTTPQVDHTAAAGLESVTLSLYTMHCIHECRLCSTCFEGRAVVVRHSYFGGACGDTSRLSWGLCLTCFEGRAVLVRRSCLGGACGDTSRFSRGLCSTCFEGRAVVHRRPYLGKACFDTSPLPGGNRIKPEQHPPTLRRRRCRGTYVAPSQHLTPRRSKRRGRGS